jgi:hypothetical protein
MKAIASLVISGELTLNSLARRVAVVAGCARACRRSMHKEEPSKDGQQNRNGLHHLAVNRTVRTFVAAEHSALKTWHRGMGLGQILASQKQSTSTGPFVPRPAR